MLNFRYSIVKSYKSEYLLRRQTDNIKKYLPYMYALCLKHTIDFFMNPEWSETGRFHIHINCLFKSPYHKLKFLEKANLKGTAFIQRVIRHDNNLEYLQKDAEVFRDYMAELDLDFQGLSLSNNYIDKKLMLKLAILRRQPVNALLILGER